MSRTAYKNEYIREHYDRINLCVPKGGKAKIRAVADAARISVNEYLFMLVCADIKDGESRISKQRQEFTEEHRK